MCSKTLDDSNAYSMYVCSLIYRTVVSNTVSFFTLILAHAVSARNHHILPKRKTNRFFPFFKNFDKVAYLKKISSYRSFQSMFLRELRRFPFRPTRFSKFIDIRMLRIIDFPVRLLVDQENVTMEA